MTILKKRLSSIVESHISSFGWKVVRYHPVRRDYHSAILFNDYYDRSHRDSGVVVYSVGQWALPEPDCGPLCLFDTKLAAESFALTLNEKRHRRRERGISFEVFLCEYLPSLLDVVWDKEREKTSIYALPFETKLAKAVRLLPDGSIPV